MEELVAKKMVEMISCRSEIGGLRAKCDKYEQINDEWKKKVASLQKMCQDMNTVINRLVSDLKNQKKNPVPMKITRSVGLQVSSEQRRYVQSIQQGQTVLQHQRPVSQRLMPVQR